MNELSLSYAMYAGLQEINRRGTVFKPNQAWLTADLNQSAGMGGIVALVPESPSKHDRKGYELVNFSAPDVSAIEATVGDIWECTKEHYGLTAATMVTGAGGIPISKMRLGHFVMPGTNRYTNLVSHYGHKFFPMARLPSGSLAARVAKNTFGTVRIFGIVGRALPFVAVGLAVFDVVSIGMCAYEAQHGKR